MGAVVVDGSISSANWKKDKPKDYSGTALDSALAAYDKLAGKNVSIPKALPTMPKQSAKAFEDCIKELETAVKDMKTAAAHFKDLVKALDSVASAGKTAASELHKLADDSNDKDKRKAYSNASSTASAIALKAGEASAKYK